MPGFNEISPQHLMRLVGTPECPVIIDVRIAEDLAVNPSLVPGSTCHDFTDIESIRNKIADRKAVVICHKGKKLSFGVAALLQSQGVAAEVLSGGFEAWRKEGLPSVPLKRMHDLPKRWVTRHRPKIDRLACPWLIRRFIDPTAQFLFVPPAEVNDVADRFGATPFDMQDSYWTHHDDKCTFDHLQTEFNLSHSALDRLAVVVRAADTNRHDLAPQAAGLLAISTGLSRQYKNDIDQMNAGMHIYDALYRWAQDAYQEGHDWPNPSLERNGAN